MRSVTEGLLHEDLLAYLPRKSLQEYVKGRVIYDAHHSPTDLYVVILGRVKVSNSAANGCETVCRIVRTEGLFGESCLLGPTNHRTETATALENATLMCWSRADIEAQIDREPHLGIALSQYLVRQCI